jgi:hypothetical protein
LSIEAFDIEFLQPIMSTERPVFVAHALCPPHLRKQVEDVAENFNPDWLLPPVDGEVFGSFQECFTRL